MKPNEFNQKKTYSEASGSIAVVDSNIKMVLNEFGLYEEVLINRDLEIQNTVSLVSPSLNGDTSETEVANSLYGNVKNIQHDSRIGFYTSLYVGHVKEGDYRTKASSGGMGTWIFKELFDNNMIDYVIHVKKNTSPNNGKLFKYDVSSTIEAIKEGAKTKYYPVELSEVMDIVKNKPGRYAIIGIPSFIYSVRLLAANDEIIKKRIKYTIGLICGHQKSTKFAESMAWQVGISPGNLVDIDFRHKFSDKPASNYGVKMIGYIDGQLQTIVKPTSDLFGQNWGWGFFKPEASDYTDDVFNETADIVLGDAWLEEYITDSNGNNVVIIRNTEIDQLVKVAIAEGRLKMDTVDKETIFSSQASHYRHTHDELSYRLYVKDLMNEWRPQKRVSAEENISKTRQKIQDLRIIISNQSHLVYKEAVERNDFNYFVEKMREYINEYTNLYRINSRKMRLKRIIKMGPIEFFSKLVDRLIKK